MTDIDLTAPAYIVTIEDLDALADGTLTPADVTSREPIPFTIVCVACGIRDPAVGRHDGAWFCEPCWEKGEGGHHYLTSPSDDDRNPFANGFVPDPPADLGCWPDARGWPVGVPAAALDLAATGQDVTR